jgi:pimeloyl-ACP methyl ester carboxylesterase
LVIHGISSSADTFAITRDSIIVFLLSQGYEVWAANSRGTKYSCTHEQLSNKSKEYWDFSFQEMAEFDVPSFYSAVLDITSVETLTLIAHSQGATQSFAALSMYPDLQSKTARFIALAPVLFMNRFPENPNIFTYLSYLKLPQLADALNIYALDHVNSGQNPIFHFLIDLVCVKTSFLCKWILSLSTEKFPENIDFEQMPKFLSFNPSGASVKSFKHFVQLIFAKDPKFQKYDYGKEENLRRYNSEFPPQYDISKIKTKVALFYGEGDNLCTLENIAFINSAKKDCYNYYMDLWGHVDYTWGKDKSRFFTRLLDAIVL